MWVLSAWEQIRQFMASQSDWLMLNMQKQVITVGGPDADIAGFTSGAIQIALDAVKTRGGGTVKLNPGVYDIIGPVRLSENTSLTGSGKTTILKKCDGLRPALQSMLTGEC